MNTVQNTVVSPDVLAAVNAARTTSKSAADEAQDRFMTLLVTQMKNQDPLNPMDNAEVTSQFAQLSTVTGISQVNATLKALIGDVQGGQSLQQANLIGHGVFVPGNSLTLDKGTGVFGIDLADAATKVTVTVRDSNGIAVRTLELGAEAAGITPHTWDGLTDAGAAAAKGRYSFDVTAAHGSDKVSAATLSYGDVTSVSRDGTGVKLDVSGIGPVNYADVQQIL